MSRRTDSPAHLREVKPLADAAAPCFPDRVSLIAGRALVLTVNAAGLENCATHERLLEAANRLAAVRRANYPRKEVEAAAVSLIAETLLFATRSTP